MMFLNLILNAEYDSLAYIKSIYVDEKLESALYMLQTYLFAAYKEFIQVKPIKFRHVVKSHKQNSHVLL